MTERSVSHASFSLNRRLAAPPARVWHAYADPVQKRKWFVDIEGFATSLYRLDCREGGVEEWNGKFGDTAIEMLCNYVDVVEGERLVIAYAMKINGARISVSVQTTEFLAEGAGTLLKLHEYGAYLDGQDNPAQRQTGTEELLDRLARYVEGAPDVRP